MRLYGWPDPAMWEKNIVVAWTGTEKEFEAPVATASLKLTLGGPAQWKVGSKRFRPTERQAIFVGEGEGYAIRVGSPLPVTTLGFFFRPGFLSDASTATKGIELGGAALASARWLRHIAGDPRYEPMEVDQEFARLAALSFGLQEASNSDLVKRLAVLRDAIHDDPARAWSLDTLAPLAYLSPCHCHRLYRLAFGQTIHAELTAERLRQARMLLTATDQTISQIAQTVGFSSESSFIRLFRKQTGVTPARYRLNIARSDN